MSKRGGLPRQGWVGLLLVAVSWPLNWGLPGMRTHLLFFPLWLGYILVVDAWVERRSGTSLLTRSAGGFALLFAASIPTWWLFEILNWRLENWFYIGRGAFTDRQYFLLASLSFSTVIPAVLETAELLRTAPWIHRLPGGARIGPRPRNLAALAAAGVLMLALLLAWPRLFYPLVWVSLVCLLEPACALLGRPSLLGHLEEGDWRPLVSLAAGALTCGFFWEMWNIHSYPKWVYRIPGLGFAHLFEMPALGYLGYLPFGLEVYLVAQLLLPRSPDLRL